MKRPAFQFYPADWQKDSELQSCPISTRGLWIEMLCIMHQCAPYGHLAVNGRAMSVEQLARLVGERDGFVRRALAELEDAGVYSRTDDGCIYCRRMVRDEDIRNRRAAGGGDGAEYGHLGGKHGAKGGRPKTPLVTPLRAVEKPPPSVFSLQSSTSEGQTLLSGKPDDALRFERVNGYKQTAREILAFLNEKAKRQYRAVEANLDPIVARLKEGASVEDLRAVVAMKCREWIGDEDMAKYLRPETLFGKRKYAGYEGQLHAVS